MSQHHSPLRARINRARQLLQENSPADARILYLQLCEARPGDPGLRLELALANRRTGHYREAVENCRQALALAPGNALAYHLQGSALHCLHDYGSAIEAYRTALQLEPNNAETCYFLGNSQQATGQLEQAAENYRNALRLRPGYLEAMGNLGAVLVALHRYGEAQAILEDANRLYPGHPQILCNLGDLNMLQDRTGQALDYARAALGISPDFFDARYLLGRIYRHQRNYDLALEHFRKALELQPRNENLMGSIAELLEIRGEFDMARELLQQPLQRGSSNPLVLKAFSTLARHYGNETEAITLLEDALARGQMDIAQSIKLHSELGKQYDHLQEFAHAFEHYSAANRLERQLNRAIMNTAVETFTRHSTISGWTARHGRDFWSRLPDSGNTSRQPVFVIGMPRSGTTLAEQILSSHPQAHGAGELPDIDDIALALRCNTAGREPFRHMPDLRQDDLAAAADRYLAKLRELTPGARRIVDKMPTNFWHVGMISLLFPNARIIHMQRDPRDVCLSMFFQRFSASMTFTTDLGELAEYYLAYGAVMDYWKEVLDIRILDVRYEELVADPETNIRTMIGFCDLDWDDSCLAFHESGRDVHTPSYDQVRQPMYSKSVGRWKHYAEQLAPLCDALGLEC